MIIDLTITTITVPIMIAIILHLCLLFGNIEQYRTDILNGYVLALIDAIALIGLSVLTFWYMFD